MIIVGKNKTDMEQNTKMPLWAKWAIFLLIVLVMILGCIIAAQDTNEKLEKAKDEKKEIVAEIDSLKAKRDDVIKNGKENAQSEADEANELIKTINNEKIYIVRDTTYNAMCEFITNYKPTGNK